MSDLHVNSTGLFEDVLVALNVCKTNLTDAQSEINQIDGSGLINDTTGSSIAGGISYAAGGAITSNISVQKIKVNLSLEIATMIAEITEDISNITKKIEDFDNAEYSNMDIISLVMDSVKDSEIELEDEETPTAPPKNPTVPPQIPTIEPESPTTQPENNNVGDLEQDAIELEDDEGVQTETPTDVEDLDKEEVDVELEGNVPDTQVQAVIELIYGEDMNLTEEQNQRIVEAIAEINKTEILEGLEENIANKIRAEIVQNYLDGELDLIGITKEDLQEYIDSQPSIKIQFELNKAIQSFESLIESGLITEEQLQTIIEENVEICDSEEAFQEAYINAGGTQTDISEIESFYDPIEKKVYIRNTVESTTITYSIITILGDIAFYDEETGQVSYYTDAPDLNTDVNVDMSNNTTDNSTITEEVEDIDTNVDINMSDETVDTGTVTQVEDIDTNPSENKIDNTTEVDTENAELHSEIESEDDTTTSE